MAGRFIGGGGDYNAGGIDPFAVNTLKAVRDRGGSTQNALAVLSGYLGHVKYRYTAVYLKVLDAEHRNSLVDFAIGCQEEI